MTRKSIRPVSLPILLALALLLACAVWRTVAPRAGASASAADAPSAPTAVSQTATRETPPDDAAAVAGFRRWLSSQPASADGPRPDYDPAALSDGVKLATARRARIARLIQENPEQAIAESITYAEWDALPAEIQALVEKPFSMVADYAFYPVCGDGHSLPPGAPEYVAELSTPGGQTLKTYVFGTRLEHMSKRRLPVQGIALDGMAALRPETLQPLSDADLAAVRRMFGAEQAAGGGPLTAIAGGRLIAFSNNDDLAAANERLALADARPGPVAASSYLLPSGEGEIDWSKLETFADEQATAWTETKKKVFLIRVNFPDNTADPVSQSAASTVLNGVVSNTVLAISYGKTWIEAGVSANLYTMPQNTTYYANGGSGLNSELLRDARNTFRNNKSGADAAINIGPVSNNTSGDGGGLGDYDIVGVTFGNIGMVSGGVYYAGLAGGGNLWMQNSNSSGVYIHEFGHNYGIGHASSWDVTSTNPADPAGTSTEYGDIFDIMGGGPDPEGHFHAQAKSKLDWLTTAQWQDATALGSNTYRVYRIDDAATATANNRGVRVTKAASPAEYYWLSYRPAFAANATQTRGVYLNWQRSGQTRCWLLDTTPNSTSGKNDSSVTLGRTYSDTTANVHITPVAVGGTGADQWVDVRVNIGPFPGNAAPAVDPIAGSATVPARSSAAYTGSATDSNGDALAWNWNSKDGLVNDNANSITHTWTVGGTYSLDLTVSDMKGGASTVTQSVTVTDPLDTWTAQTSGSTSYLRASTWGKGRFVVIDLWGTVLTSWDGVTWTNNGDLPDFDRDPRLAFGNDVFVAVGKKDGAAASQICYSRDARTWNVATFPAGVPQMREVAFANGKFVAAGDGGNVLTSADGITWSLTTVGGTPDFRYLAWDGSAWLALSYKTASSRTETVWTSANGTTWSQQGDLGFGVDGVLGRPGMFLATGWYGGVKYSTDHGLTWKSAQTPGSTRWSTNQIAVADDGTLLAGAKAMDESGTPQAWLVSTNGTDWARSSAGVGNGYDTKSLVFGFGRFLATADGGAIRTSGSFYPNNTAPSAGFALAPATAPARESRLFAATATDAEGDTLTYSWDFGLPALITDGPNIVKSFDFGGSYTATVRVSDGKGGLTTLTQAVTVSDPARTFVQRTSGTTKTLNAIATNGGIAVAGSSGGGAVVLTSPDGVTWTTRALPSSTNKYIYSISWDGSKFIAVGQDYNFTISAWVGLVLTSPDGITWTQRYASATGGTTLNAVSSDGTGHSVAVGNVGTIIESADGITWNPVSVAALASTTLRGASYGSGTWLITGHSGGNGTPKVFTSTDRTSWMDQTAGSGLASWQDIRKTAYLNNRFVGSGWYSKVRVSTDLGATFTTTRTDSEETPALAYGDTIYFAAGVNRSDSSADIDLLSLDGTTWTRSTAPTTDDRNGAVFFKHTFITVGAGGTIWQSADVTPGGATPNDPPVFNGHAFTTPYGTAATVSSATLVAASSDPNGDAIVVTAAGPSSAHGGVVSVGGGNVAYTPPAGFSGADSFQITLTDARGATANGTVDVTVQPAPFTSPPTLTRLPGGQVGLSYQGIAGGTYEIQRSTDLTGWTVLATVTAAGNGAVTYTDPSPPAGKAFYRISKP
ncbi:MAG: PKD domain-containing protein [Verrucomicrobia bacterium]|nr:PKD domain-containing protein [Verrucomicrobiota bacterium]